MPTSLLAYITHTSAVWSVIARSTSRGSTRPWASTSTYVTEHRAPCAVQAAVEREPGAEVALPVVGGRRGHPVCLAGRLLPELYDVREETQGLRGVVRRHAVREVPVSDDEPLLNLNDVSAYEAAYARLRRLDAH